MTFALRVEVVDVNEYSEEYTSKEGVAGPLIAQRDPVVVAAAENGMTNSN